MRIRRLFFTLLWFCFSSMAFGQANGKLQIHHIDVGQGDGAVLISPGGQVVLFDAGQDRKRHDCTKPVSYLDQLGVRQIDYLFISHYHSDHIGCIPAVLQQFPLQHDAFDRGESYPGATYQNYVAAVGSHRKTATLGSEIRLDADSSTPVVIKVVAMNGRSLSGSTVQTSNENDLSLAAVVSFGAFREEIGGDLSGDNTQMYQDVETPDAPDVGRIDVYKVHHHCSSHSTNEAWLNNTKPTVGIVSAGDGNDYGHPTAECLERLHKQGVKTYWTETGNGAEPELGVDIVGGNILVQVEPSVSNFSVAYSGNRADTFAIGGAGPQPSGPVPVPSTPTFSWSNRSPVYHYTNCRFVDNISPANLEHGSSPPQGKTLHVGCPR